MKQLVIILAVISIPFVFTICLFSGMCGNEILQTELSPSGDYKAISFLRDCGATTDFSPQVSLLQKDAGLKNTAGNIFIGNHSTKIKIKWVSSKVLEISHGCLVEDINLMKKSYRDFTVKYAYQP